MDKEIVIDNKLEEVPKISQFVEELSMTLKLPSEITMGINLAIEEAVTNIIRYAYPAGKSSEILLRVNVTSGVLTFTIVDEGISFDPRKRETPDMTLSLEQRLVKGLGLFLIRRTMDEVDYQTFDGRNHLTLIKRIDMDFKPEATLKTNICKIDGVTILSIEGRLDTANSREFNNVMQPLLSEVDSNIIINCEGMTYISSSGLRSLITLQKSVMQNHGQLALEAVRPEILAIFNMTGCSTLFTIR